MIKIDEESIFKEIKERKAVSVALNAPDGLLPKVQETASKIMKRFGIPAYVLADTTWGSCDLNSNGAKVLAADVLFNIGHTISLDIIEKNVVMIDAFDDISFEKIAEKCVNILKGKTISLITDSQHLHQIEPVKKILEAADVKVNDAKVKALVASLEGVDIQKAIEEAVVAAPAASAPSAGQAKEEVKDESDDEDEQ